jgi:site-specific recombinase XerD
MRDVRNRTDATVNTYGVTLQSWVNWRHSGILTATQRDMERWVQRPRPRRGHGNVGAPATRKKDIAVLRSFYRWLVASGDLTVDPTLGLHGPTVHNILPKPVDDDVWHKVWTSLKLTDDERVFLGLGYFAGLRRQEMTRLKRTHFTPDRIVGMVRKGGSEAAVPYAEMHSTVLDALPALAGDPEAFYGPLERARARRARDPWLLPWQIDGGIDPGMMNKRLIQVCRRVGVEMFTPHQLRHSAATNLIRAGVPVHLVSRLMNHTSVDVTMRYVRAGGDELAEWRRRTVGSRR